VSGCFFSEDSVYWTGLLTFMPIKYFIHLL